MSERKAKYTYSCRDVGVGEVDSALEKVGKICA